MKACTAAPGVAVRPVLFAFYPDQGAVTDVYLQHDQSERQAGYGDEEQVAHVQAQALQVGAVLAQHLEERWHHEQKIEVCDPR